MHCTVSIAYVTAYCAAGTIVKSNFKTVNIAVPQPTQQKPQQHSHTSGKVQTQTCICKYLTDDTTTKPDDAVYTVSMKLEI